MFGSLPRPARLFLAGRWISSGGDWLAASAFGWLIAVELAGGSAAFALSRLVLAAAVILFASVAGPTLERRSAVAVLVGSCLVAGFTSIAVACLAGGCRPSAGSMSNGTALLIAMIFAFVAGAATAFRDGAEQRYQAQLVPAHHQHRLEQAWTITYYLGRIIFGLVAGVLLGMLGSMSLFLLDAATFIVLAGFAIVVGGLCGIRAPLGELPEPTRKRSWGDALADLVRSYGKGARAVLVRPGFLLLLWLLFVIEGIGFTAWSLLPELISSELKETGLAYGVVICISGGGGLLGVLLWGALCEQSRVQRKRLFVAGIVMAPAGLIGVALSNDYLLVGAFYAVAICGWSWFLPPLRIFFRMDRQAALLTAMLTLTLYGFARVSQVVIAVTLLGAGLRPSQVLLASSSSATLLLLLTLLLFRRKFSVMLEQIAVLGLAAEEQPETAPEDTPLLEEAVNSV